MACGWSYSVFYCSEQNYKVTTFRLQIEPNHAGPELNQSGLALQYKSCQPWFGLVCLYMFKLASYNRAGPVSSASVNVV